MKVISQRGFTLLEILLAITIMGVVVSAATIAINSSIKVAEITQNEKKIGRQARVALQRITEDVASIVGGEKALFEAEGGNESDSFYLSFTSAAHAGLNRAINTTGSVIVNYRVVQKENDPPVYQLVRFERPAIETIATPGDIGFVLCDNLKSVEFTFQDSSGQKLDYWRQPEKEDEELTEVLLPSAVFIRLEFWEDVLKDTTISFQTATWPVVAFFSGAEDG